MIMKKTIILAALSLPLLLIASCNSGPSKPLTGKENDHDWVDLGLSVKWSTCNVGADAPEAAGEFYAWGEIDISNKKSYDWENYKWGTREALTKYNPNKFYGKTDSKTVLLSDDDTASRKWGEPWRTPTREEWKELYEKCTWEWQNNGFKVTGPSKQSIFIPAAGIREDAAKPVPGIGYYWSSELSDNQPIMAGYFKCSAMGGELGSYIRCAGLSIRPVLAE